MAGIRSLQVSSWHTADDDLGHTELVGLELTS